MILFDIVLRKLSLVFYGFMGQIIRRIRFLQHSISHVFLISKDTFYLIARPFAFAHTGRDFLLVKDFHNHVWIDSFHKRLVNPFYHFGLFRVYDQFTVFIRIVAIETICIEMMDTSLK